MKRFLPVFTLAVLLGKPVLPQCVVTGSTLPDIIVCGDCAQLSANGRGQGQIVFQENFNSGAPTGWYFTQQGRFDNPCSPNGVDGTTHIWMGNTSAVPRSLETIAYNFSTALSGVSICFDMLFSTQGVSAPCEGPDEPDEGVYLQYRIGSGQWINIHYFDPNGGYDPQFVNWNNWCFQLPPAAITGNVSIRWFQDNDSGADYDHWGIDNVVIYYNDPSYVITWIHDGYTYPAPGGINPTPVCPRVTTDYAVMMTNNTHTCWDTVRVVVESPIIIVDAGTDTTVCAGECATLNGTAKVIRSPGGPKTYFTSEPDTITSAFGNLVPGEVNINVTRLNMTNITGANGIVQVCIDSASAHDQVVFPGLPPLIPPIILDYNLSQFSFELLCPDGNVVTLIPAGILDTTSNDLSGTCFVPSGGSAITSSGEPYTGSFNPGQSLGNMNGCAANGIWKLRISSIFGQAIIRGWSITFNDIEINYPADFSWSPTTNMTNSNTLTPTVCPPSTQNYTLTAQDTAGCVVESDIVAVNVTQTCCNLSFTGTSVNATSCVTPDGSITITVNSGSGGYLFAWDDNASTQNRTALSAGTYSVTVTDTIQNCQRDTSFIITGQAGPQIIDVTVTHETCNGYNDGTASASAAGGTGSLSYSWSTSQTGQSISNVPPGAHSVTVTDASGCFDVSAFIIDPGLFCCTLQVANSVVQPNCGQSNGAITLTVTGSGNYSYSWSNSATTKDIANLSAGVYSVTVNDIDQNCSSTISVNLSNSNANAPVIDSIVVTVEPCAGDNDGAAAVFASGGNGALSILWSNNETTAIISGLAPGIYSVSVSDTLGCQAFGSDTLTVGPVCCNLQSSATKIDAACNAADGAITITVDSLTGTAPFQYSINAINYVSANQFTNLSPGTYYPSSQDANGCTDVDTILLVEANNTIVISTQSNPITCFGDNDGMAQVDTSGGNPPLNILWSNSSTGKTIINLAPGDYYVTVTDQLNCQRKDTVTITEPAEIIVDLGGPIDFCIGGSVTLSAGNFSQYVWSTGDSVSSVAATQSGSYSVTVYDANGCSAESNVNVTVNALPSVDAGLDSTIFDFESLVLSPAAGGVVNPSGFEWNPGTGLSCANCRNPVASPDSTIRYYLAYTDNNGCFDTSSILITVEHGNFYAVVPNAFSPNGDGNNDVLYVYHEGVNKLVFRVFNRWGALIFETHSLSEGWDGSFKGKLLSPDVFVYHLDVDFFNLESKRAKGSVTLLR